MPDVLLPKKIETKKWAVIACDQYTQNQEYWNQVEKNCKESPSTLNLILPEIYLNSPDKKERISKIRSTMKNYLDNGIFDSEKKEFIYIERKTAFGRCRHGLLACINLDNYEWEPFSKALVRATEATILDRIPPRKEIRNGAPLELPHIMLLVNDPEHILVEATGEKVKKTEKAPLYSGDLMQNGGSITGWAVNTEDEIAEIQKSLNIIAENNTEKDGSVFLFAVGDGNHSLATAKTVWEGYKQEMLKNGKSKEEIEKSPVRFAMVEIVNLYDSGLTFEPIHRVIFNADAKKLISFAADKLGGKITEKTDFAELSKTAKDNSSGANFGFAYTENGKTKFLTLSTKINELAVAHLQPVLDKFIEEENKSDAEISIDYIHGEDELLSLGKKDNAVALLLPPITKDSFFATINGRGPLPRKSFSMGEADEKRFYMECRRLF